MKNIDRNLEEPHVDFRTRLYELFIAPLLSLKEVRELIAGFIGRESVIDIGCGPGTLALELADIRGCDVLGVDVAAGRIARAKQHAKNSPHLSVHFKEADATNLVGIKDGQFDVATISMIIHGLPEDIRIKVLNEAMRVAERIVIADYLSVQPKTFAGMVVRGVEYTGEHPQGFNSFITTGGLDPLLQTVGLEILEERINSSGTIRALLVTRRRASSR